MYLTFPNPLEGREGLSSLVLPIGEVRTPSPALCIVMGAGWGYRNGLDTECPDSVGFTIW